MAKKKQMPAPKPEYVFPIPEANKILGNAYTDDGNANVERTNSRMLKPRNKDEMRSDQEQLKYAANDIRVGKEYLSGKRNAFNLQRELHKKNQYMPDLYQPMMETNSGIARINTRTFPEFKERSNWVGNDVADVLDNSKIYWGKDETLPQHLQMNQFKKYTKEEASAGLVWGKPTNNTKKAYVTNADFHKNVEQAYKQGSVKAPKTTKKPKEETGAYPQLSLF